MLKIAVQPVDSRPHAGVEAVRYPKTQKGDYAGDRISGRRRFWTDRPSGVQDSWCARGKKTGRRSVSRVRSYDASMDRQPLVFRADPAAPEGSPTGDHQHLHQAHRQHPELKTGSPSRMFMKVELYVSSR